MAMHTAVFHFEVEAHANAFAERTGLEVMRLPVVDEDDPYRWIVEDEDDLMSGLVYVDKNGNIEAHEQVYIAAWISSPKDLDCLIEDIEDGTYTKADLMATAEYYDKRHREAAADRNWYAADLYESVVQLCEGALDDLI